MNRVGLRYINIIPFVRNNGIIPLNDFLTIDFILPNSIGKDFQNINFIFTSQLDEGYITTKIQSMLSKNNQEEAILLDFDFSLESDLFFSNINEYLENGHSVTKRFFEDFITDEYRSYIKGEVL